jgi:hypothetical protein
LAARRGFWQAVSIASPARTPPSLFCQYIFFGGRDRRICLRNLATAAAFFRLRSALGVSYVNRARSSFSRPVFSIERRKRRSATSTGSFGLGITVVIQFPGCDPDNRGRDKLRAVCQLPLRDGSMKTSNGAPFFPSRLMKLNGAPDGKRCSKDSSAYARYWPAPQG